MTLTASGLTLSVEGVDHLRDITLDLRPGRIYTVIGRTLAGKSSLLRVLAGLQRVDAGTLTQDGTDLLQVPVWRRDTAMVYQQFINYPHLNVFDNVAFPLRRAKLSGEQVRLRATESLAKVGLSDFHARKPSQLSGGQQQRVALARALARRCKTLLLDEPLVNLDYKLREQLREEFRELFSGVGDSVVVYTTTETTEAMMLGDEVIVMHEGRIVQTGTPAEVFDAPATTTVAQIINEPPMNIIPGTVTGGRMRLNDLGAVDLPAHLAGLPDGPCQFGLRATDLSLSSSEGLRGDVTFVEISGSETFVHVVIADIPMVVQLEGIHDVSLGDAVLVTIRSDRLFAFSAQGDLLVAPSEQGGR